MTVTEQLVNNIYSKQIFKDQIQPMLVLAGMPEELANLIAEGIVEKKYEEYLAAIVESYDESASPELIQEFYDVYERHDAWDLVPAMAQKLQGKLEKVLQDSV